ncbi:MAG TPA: sodium-translocating pyrophosphatase [Acholeplasmataceae bacterium]|jgi:K(+)-stimulated pyrophosphate-energized sodium pump|nr:sodium-translocating pyrophosphatase [Acholeplasmataceae bacterium]
MKPWFFFAGAILISVIAFFFAGWLYAWVNKQPSSNKKIATIGKYIRQGANTFLKKEYQVLAKFAGVAAVLIFVFLPEPIWKSKVLDNVTIALAYIFGTVFSAIAGKIGITIATIANIKTAEAAQKGIKPSFLSGFRGGAVMGMGVVGSSVLGVALLLWITNNTTALLGFSFGASSLALFAKAGGGIFTKTADVSADLVGKVELGIPEDDPRNPAVIADNVGDNVGDVAGMGADLFDSHVASLAAAMVIAANLDGTTTKFHTLLVLCFAVVGLLSSIIGVAFAKMGKTNNPTKALNTSTYLTTGIYVALTALVTWGMNAWQKSEGLLGKDYGAWLLWGAAILGLLVGVIIGITTDYFTNDVRKPVQLVAKASETGPAFTILSGVSYGFLSVLPAMIGIAISALVSYQLCKPLGGDYPLFGVSIAAVGMLSIVGMIISNDAYGPIVDNARGLAEMGDLGEEVVEITDTLDSAGNTVKAVTKGFSIGAAGLTVIALLFAFINEANEIAVTRGLAQINFLDIMDPLVFFGLVIGAAIPAVFSAMLMLGVDRNAQRMVGEIHRQFKEIPGLMEGKEGVVPEYDKCIEIATHGAIKELIPAGLFAILLTIVVGFIGGIKAVGGYLAGNIVSGLLLSLFMSNSGGLWDNSKKFIEAGNHGGKGSNAHKAAVVGDTVGDPFKDTAGPSINTQITVVSLVASLLAALFLTISLF